MAKKISFYGCFLAAAIIFGYVEFLLPINMGIPGIKLGLANIVAVFILYKKGLVPALTVNIARIIVCGILFGTVLSASYALCGGICSVLIMALFKKFKCFSAVGVSVAGACIHNIAQLLASYTVLQTPAVFYYLPFLIIAGEITGIVIGIVSELLVRRVHLT